MAEVIDITKNKDQPKPKFTLLDLERQLDAALVQVKTKPANFEVNLTVILHGLLAEVERIKTNLDVIEMPVETAKAITDTIETEKPEMIVCGVQLFEYSKIQGTSLYTTIVKARKIRNVLNTRFAELKVDHFAKIVNYPVY
jgi:hypothetical protein